MKLASHVFGKTRSYRGSAFVGIVVDIVLERGSLRGNVTLKSSAGPLSSAQMTEALKLYEELLDWAKIWTSHSALREIIVPPHAINGKWPPMDALEIDLLKFTGIALVHKH